MAKINVTQELKGLDGKPAADDSGKIQTLRSVCINALLAMNENERIDGEEKLARYKLAQTIHDKDEIDLAVEQIARIKQAIAANYSPLAVGRAFEILDPEK